MYILLNYRYLQPTTVVIHGANNFGFVIPRVTSTGIETNVRR